MLTQPFRGRFSRAPVVGLVIEGLNGLETRFMTADSHLGALDAGQENSERPSAGLWLTQKIVMRTSMIPGDADAHILSRYPFFTKMS